MDSAGAVPKAYEGYKRDCRYVVSHLINGQDPRADHLSFSRDEGGHDQTWAVTEAQAWLHIQGLQFMSINKIKQNKIKRTTKQSHLRLSVDVMHDLNV